MNAPGAHAVNTPGFEKAYRIAQMTFDQMRMALIYGPPGVGKSFVCDEFRREYPKPITYIVVPARGSERKVVRATLEALTGLHYNTDTDTMERLVREHLTEHPCLCFDEADAMELEAFETVRRWRDEFKEKLAILFVGGRRAWEVISQRDRLADRIRYKHEFQPLTKPQMREALPLYHDIYQDLDLKTFETLWASCRGVFRRIDFFTDEVLTQMQADGIRKLTPQIVGDTLLFMGTELAMPRKGRR